MPFYSPFTYPDGLPKTVFELTYADLQQLKEKRVEGGWQVEYKSVYSTAVKTQIPEIICSFANELGGWLFIGIDPETKESTPVERLDFSGLINNLLKAGTSPLPKVEICFLETPADSEKGVVVVWVPEGIKPPYICNGSIYRRSENGYYPLKDSTQLDRLCDKAVEMRASVKEFCRNELTVNNSQWNSQIFRYIDRGMCNLYLIPIYQLKLLDRLKPEDWIENITTGSKKPLNYKDKTGFTAAVSQPWSKGYYSSNSLIFRNSPYLDHYKHTTAFELFWDGRARFHIPIPYVELDVKLGQNVRDVQKKEVLNDFNYIDGKEFLLKIIGCIGFYNSTMQKFFPEFNDMLIIVELENIDRDVLYFRGETYARFLREKGLVFSEKSHYLIHNEYTPVSVTTDLEQMLASVHTVMNAFGHSVENVVEFFYEAVKEKVEYASFTMPPR